MDSMDNRMIIAWGADFRENNKANRGEREMSTRSASKSSQADSRTTSTVVSAESTEKSKRPFFLGDLNCTVRCKKKKNNEKTLVTLYNVKAINRGDQDTQTDKTYQHPCTDKRPSWDRAFAPSIDS